jgi:hypothetical protein
MPRMNIVGCIDATITPPKVFGGSLPRADGFNLVVIVVCNGIHVVKHTCTSI